MEHPRVIPVKKHLDRLRRVCMGYPEVVEAEQFGTPWWKAGKKSFCIYGTDEGGSAISLNLTPEDQAVLIEDPRFSKSRYIGQHGWVSMRLTGRIDWGLVEDLVDSAYRKVALKRMLKALDGPGS